jgi:transcriptional regulator with XRE-family HTH domain
MAPLGEWRKLCDRMLAEDPELSSEYESHRWIGELIDLRLARGLTQKEVAERAGTTQSVISRLESGGQEPTLRFLRKVVEAVGGELNIQIKPAREAEQSGTQDEARARKDARARDQAA